MNKAKEMKENTQKTLQEKYPFNQEVYNNILMLIKQKALEGERSIIIYFHSCNYNYLKPYLDKLEEDGFSPSAFWNSTYEDPFGMGIMISW